MVWDALSKSSTSIFEWQRYKIVISSEYMKLFLQEVVEKNKQQK